MAEGDWSGLRTAALALSDSTNALFFAKIDIEGGEYRLLPDLVADAAMFSGMVIEFHDCDLCSDALESILMSLHKDFAVVHAHGNNCAPVIAGTDVPRAIEVSLVNRKLLSASENSSRSSRSYPLAGLDMPCDPARKDPTLFTSLSVVG